MIDSGSQKTLILEETVEILGIPKIKATTEISGVSVECVEVTHHKVQMEIRRRFISKFVSETEALVLSKLHKALAMTYLKRGHLYGKVTSGSKLQQTRSH